MFNSIWIENTGICIARCLVALLKNTEIIVKDYVLAIVVIELKEFSMRLDLKEKAYEIACKVDHRKKSYEFKSYNQTSSIGKFLKKIESSKITRKITLNQTSPYYLREGTNKKH
jgi:hypothetical protein